MIVSKQSKQLRKDLHTLCSYAKSTTQHTDIDSRVDSLKSNILHRLERMENTLALNRIMDERLVEDIKYKATKLVIDTYDEEGNQD
jgi:hypothetical protein